jgi:WD40 repeat protein
LRELGHGDGVNAIASSPDGRELVSVTNDKNIRFWDAWSGECVATFKGPDGWVDLVAFSPDGKQVASGSYDKTVKLLDAR